jgi:hypothetical protein
MDDLRSDDTYAVALIVTARNRQGGCYVSDKAELTIAAIAGDIQDRA